jgi:hypothetical protein
MRLFVLSLILQLYCLNIQAAYVDRMKVQHAGEIGLLAFGLGKKISKKYQFDILYGYVPKNIAGTEIETYSFKNDYLMYEYEFLNRLQHLYIGVNIYHVIGLKYQTSRLNSYPRNYYRMSSIRFMPYLGYKILWNKKSEFFLESGVNDIWLVNYYNNLDEINLADYASLAIGWTKNF